MSPCDLERRIGRMNRNMRTLKHAGDERAERQQHRRGLRKAAAIALALAVASSLAAPAGVFADDAQAAASSDSEVSPAQTTVTGYVTSHNRKDYTKTMTDTIKVAPAYGRVVSVYHYDQDAKKWVKESSVTTGDTYESKVKLVFSDYWKTISTTKYKIVINKVNGSGASFSGTLTPRYASKDAVQSVGASKVSKKMTTTFNPVTAKTAVVMNADTHELVYQKNADTTRKPSSMTKMMTGILLREKYSLGHKVKITSESARTPWGIGLKSGDTMTVQNLLYAMFLPSANDAACASGIAVGGSTARFASLMNARAAQLGCTRTVYKNAHGLDTTGNYSTARDQALVGSYIMTSPKMSDIRKVLLTKSKVIYSGKGRKYSLYSSNALLGTGTFQGLKTGTTTLGGYSFCGAYTCNGQTYVSVVMGSATSGQRFTDTKTLAGLTEELESE